MMIILKRPQYNITSDTKTQLLGILGDFLNLVLSFASLQIFMTFDPL